MNLIKIIEEQEKIKSTQKLKKYLGKIKKITKYKKKRLKVRTLYFKPY